MGSCTNDQTQCTPPTRRIKFDILGPYLYSAAEMYRSFKPDGFSQETQNKQYCVPGGSPGRTQNIVHGEVYRENA